MNRTDRFLARFADETWDRARRPLRRIRIGQMNDGKLSRAAALFDELIGVPVDQRSSLLAVRCDGDEALRTLVGQLLAHDERGLGDFLHRPDGSCDGLVQPGVARLLAADAMSLAPPSRIGRYRIVGELGRGGAGVVYEAVQDSPSRAVALKVICAGYFAPDAVRRFTHEAEILGALQHPGIAQIYEAGTAEVIGPLGVATTVPFFAMELVRGDTLTRFAERAGLDVRARLELLARVCDAVQYAHQKGVIHRDLKPGNILVVEVGFKGPRGQRSEGSSVAEAQGPRVAGRAAVSPPLTPRPLSPSAPSSSQPKVLDFGIARATGDDFRTLTLRTEVGQIVGTVPYMSPEQLSGDSRQIDTRSDVYALGVVLFELLSGALPHDVLGCSLPQAVRLVRDEPPRLLGALRPGLRGEVETICAKALHRDREQRYQSAAALADDIRRYLSGAPIEAKRDSLRYVLGKRLRRHWVAATVAIGFVLLLTGGLAASLTFWHRSAQAAERAGSAERQAREAERTAKSSLADAYAAQARERRLRREVGFTDESLDLLRQAAAIHGPTLELRNEALASLAQADFVLERTLPAPADLNAGYSLLQAARLICATHAGKVSVARIDDGSEYWISLPEPDDELGGLALSRDGRFMFLRYQKRFARGVRIGVWDVEQRRGLWQRPVAGVGAASRFDFSPDGDWIAVAHPDRTIRLHAVADGALVREVHLGFHIEGLRHLRLGQRTAGLLLCDAERARLVIWDFATDAAEELPLPSKGRITAQSDNGRWLAVGCVDGRIVVYRVDPNGASWPAGTSACSEPPHALLNGHDAVVKRLHFALGGELLVSFADDVTTRFWDLPRGRERLAPLYDVTAIGADADWIALADKGVSLRSLRPSEICRTLNGFKGTPIFVDDAVLALCGWSGLALIDRRSGAYLDRIEDLRVSDAARVNGGLLLATVDGLALALLDEQDAPPRLRPPVLLWKRSGANALGVLPDESAAFMGIGDDRVWRIPLDDPSAATLFIEQVGARPGNASPDGARLAVGHWRGNEAVVYSVADGRRLFAFETPYEATQADARFAYAADGGGLLIVATASEYTFFDADTYERLHSIPRSGWLTSLAVSPDGRLAMITLNGSTPALIDLRSLEVLAELTLPEPNFGLLRAAFSPDGGALLMTTNGSPMFLWDITAIPRRLAQLGLDWPR